jgi:LCP family protein required for cell wall assembly
LIIKKIGDLRSIPWQAALAAAFVVLAGMALFLFTCRAPESPLAKFERRLNFGQPAAVAQPLIGPSLPSMDLVPKLSQRMTILLMGVDSNGLNAPDPFTGTRSDTMMLVSIDPLENKVGVVSIPRDSRVRIPSHGVDKINSAHAFGGPTLSMQTVREAFGVPCDHYIEVDTGGLKKLFEILGPVEVLVEKEMKYVDHTAKLNVDLKPGLQVLTPEQTEEYVRFRHDARGDIGRIERQQWFVRQAAKKFKEPQIVLKLPQLVCLAYQCVRTDLSMQDLMSIALYAKDFPHERVVTAMLPGEGQMIGGGSYWVPDSVAGQVMFSKILGCSTSNIVSPDAVPGAQEILEPEDALPPPTATGLIQDNSKPPSVSIRYPKGCEQLSKAIEEHLTQAGFRVRYRYQIADADSQHELLVQQSVKATDDATLRIYQSIPEMQSFPVSVAIESRPATDFTIIVSGTSQLPSICRNSSIPTPQQSPPPLNVTARAMPLIPQE